jgi:hypothetical protein
LETFLRRWPLGPRQTLEAGGYAGPNRRTLPSYTNPHRKDTHRVSQPTHHPDNNRKERIERRVEERAEILAVAIGGFSVMDNQPGVLSGSMKRF